MTKTAVIFGGSGFIGSHFSQYLLDNKLVGKIIVADLIPLDLNKTTAQYAIYVDEGSIEYQYCDVRKVIELNSCSEIQFIGNFAAIHREPGHAINEYFETNLLGAENVCDWSDGIKCRNIIFTSSIAPYGPSEDELTESSIPIPVSAYGASKLAAEKIHIAWQKQNVKEHKLVIVRPGVVFGAGEGGNVSRLISATLNRYFFYMGNRNTRKAGIYVKELCIAMYWVLDNKTTRGYALFNMSMNPGHTICEYVDTVCKIAKVNRNILNVPPILLFVISVFIECISKLLGIKQPISPVRIKKLLLSNNIVPEFLINNGYQYKYNLEQAMEDWKKDKPTEWD